MKKLVKLIVENKSCIPEYTAQLYSVFGDAVTVRAFTIDDSAAYADQSEDAILTSASSAVNFSEIKKVHFRGKKWIPINLSLQRKSLLQLNAYPKGTQALLVNLSKRMAEETISQLYQAGYSYITFHPCYPGYTGPKLPLAFPSWWRRTRRWSGVWAPWCSCRMRGFWVSMPMEKF